MMTAILTGDIVNSQKVDSKLWLKDLKAVLRKYGKNPYSWEIFRGDTFQLEVERATRCTYSNRSRYYKLSQQKNNRV